MEEIRMMECGMWLMRLTLIFGLIGQLLWAQGNLTLRPPCPRPEPAVEIDRRPAGECAKRCCQNVPGKPDKRRCPRRGQAGAAYSPREEVAARCDVTNCCRHRMPRPPRPVDRIAPPQKRPDVALSVAAHQGAIATIPPAPARPRMQAIPLASQRNRLAALCVWRN
jgi:hypothetical protein